MLGGKVKKAWEGRLMLWEGGRLKLGGKELKCWEGR